MYCMNQMLFYYSVTRRQITLGRVIFLSPNKYSTFLGTNEGIQFLMTPGKEATVKLLTLKLKCGLSLQGVVAKLPAGSI